MEPEETSAGCAESGAIGKYKKKSMQIRRSKTVVCFLRKWEIKVIDSMLIYSF